jgi:hypothetical protein
MKRFYPSLLVYIVFLSIGSICTISAAERKPIKQAFSLVIREGFGSLTVGDLNTTLSSCNTYRYWWLRESDPKWIAGELVEVPDRFKDWEAEFQWAAWKGLSVGFAISGPIRLHDKGSVSYVYGEAETNSVESEIRVAVPVKFNLFYSLPIFSKLNLVVNGGIGLYHARMTQIYEYLYFDNPATETTGSYQFDVSGNKTGYHCGFALEYRLNNRVSMMAESQWRFAKIKSLKGSSDLTLESYESNQLISSESDSQDGYLYHYIVTDAYGFYHEELGVYADPSTIEDEVSDLRKAFLDLSGFTFKIGLRIRLF